MKPISKIILLMGAGVFVWATLEVVRTIGERATDEVACELVATWVVVSVLTGVLVAVTKD